MWCCLGWFLLGLFLGWLLNWLFDKFFRRGGSSGGSSGGYSSTSYSAPSPSPAPSSNSFAANPPAPAAPAVSAASAGAASIAAAAAAGFTKIKSPNGYDNFEIIEGIGPKINQVLHGAGVHTFSQLATMDVAKVSAILDAAGPNFKLANPGSWAQQSKLCAEGSWEALKKLQDELVAGVDLKSSST